MEQDIKIYIPKQRGIESPTATSVNESGERVAIWKPAGASGAEQQSDPQQ